MIARGNATPDDQTGGKHRRDNVVPMRPEVMGAIMNDRPAFDPSARSCGISYRLGQEVVPHCPGCGRQQWLVGRTTAECAFCAMALPLNDGHR